MAPQTPVVKRAKQAHRQRKTRAYAIVKKLAEDDGIPIDRLLEEAEARGGLREYIEIMDAIILREASETPMVD